MQDLAAEARLWRQLAKEPGRAGGSGAGKSGTASGWFGDIGYLGRTKHPTSLSTCCCPKGANPPPSSGVYNRTITEVDQFRGQERR